MPNSPKIHLDNVIAKALVEYFHKLESRLQLGTPVKVWIAGGMAVNLYTGTRPTGDIDAEFSIRLYIPDDVYVEIRLEDGSSRPIWLDKNYNPMFALLHENYQHDSIKIDLGLKDFDIYVLSPVDLVLSKIVRFSETDQGDIQSLASVCLFTEEEVEKRARDALSAYPGSKNMIEYNLKDALATIRRALKRK
jgi:hypothetical protein